MRAYVGQTRADAWIAKLTKFGIGECTVRGELPPRRSPWFFDNGAFRDFTAKKKFNARDFMLDINAIREHDLKPDFVVVPDIVAGGLKSLKFSLAWVPEIDDLPLYLAVQDGMSVAKVEPMLPLFSGLFVGGSTEWKIKTGATWAALATTHNKKCHIGRVSSLARWKWAHTTGAHSADSSSCLWANQNMNLFIKGWSKGARTWS